MGNVCGSFSISMLIWQWAWKVVPGTSTRLQCTSPRKYAWINAARTQVPWPRHRPCRWKEGFSYQKCVLLTPFTKKGRPTLLGWLWAIYQLFHTRCAKPRDSNPFAQYLETTNVCNEGTREQYWGDSWPSATVWKNKMMAHALSRKRTPPKNKRWL